MDERWLVRPYGRQLDVFAGQPPQQFDHVGDDVAEVEGFGLHHLAAAEGEELRGQMRRASAEARTSPISSEPPPPPPPSLFNASSV
jgi:hypothetical protein